jgi:hypothetical protein
LRRENLPTLLITAAKLAEPEITSLKSLGIHPVHWNSVPYIRASDHEVVILDTRINPSPGFYQVLDGLRFDLETLLRSGGVVFALLGPEITFDKHENGLVSKESHLEFLPKELLDSTELAYSASREGSYFRLLEPRWEAYFHHVRKYWRVIHGIEQGERGSQIRYRRISGPPELFSESARVLAITKTTTEVIACLISWKGGTIGLLPQTDKPESNVFFLAQIGSDIYKHNIEELGVPPHPPEWLDSYMIAEEKSLQIKVEKLNADLERLCLERNHFAKIRSCLFVTGRQLEQAMERLMSDLQWDFEDLTKSGKPIDYVVHGKGSRDLLIALTGTSGYVAADNKKIAQLFGALAEVHDNQKLVFLVNALAEKDPSSRLISDCVKEEALKRMSKHNICVLLVSDIYKLWKDCVEKRRSADQIFDLVYVTSGPFMYT